MFHFHQTDDLCQKAQTDGTKRKMNIDTLKNRPEVQIPDKFLLKDLLHLTLLQETN